jgi:Bacteriophage HK97-gp10, putative tail-component
MTVELDTRELDAGLAQLLRGIDGGLEPAAARSANSVAARLRARVPVRSGRLRATVRAETSGDGATVHYGGGLPYAGYIDGRTGATDDALDGAARTFYGAMHELAAREVHRL